MQVPEVSHGGTAVIIIHAADLGIHDEASARADHLLLALDAGQDDLLRVPALSVALTGQVHEGGSEDLGSGLLAAEVGVSGRGAQKAVERLVDGGEDAEREGVRRVQGDVIACEQEA